MLHAIPICYSVICNDSGYIEVVLFRNLLVNICLHPNKLSFPYKNSIFFCTAPSDDKNVKRFCLPKIFVGRTFTRVAYKHTK